VATLTVLVLTSFIIGSVVGGVLTYMFLSARMQQEKQRFADELHALVEREERAVHQSYHTAA